MVEFDQMFFFPFNIASPVIHTLLPSVFQPLWLLQICPPHRSNSFFYIVEQKKNGAKSGEYGWWSISSKPQSRTATISTTGLCERALSWWSRAPFVSFFRPLSNVSTTLLFKVLNFLSSAGLSGLKQSGKVEFNACQVSLPVAQLLLSQPMNLLAHPRRKGFTWYSCISREYRPTGKITYEELACKCC